MEILPNEIIERIASFLAIDSACGAGSVDISEEQSVFVRKAQATLRALACSCRRLHSIVLPHLYRQPSVAGYSPHFVLLLRTILESWERSSFTGQPVAVHQGTQSLRLYSLVEPFDVEDIDAPLAQDSVLFKRAIKRVQWPESARYAKCVAYYARTYERTGSLQMGMLVGLVIAHLPNLRDLALEWPDDASTLARAWEPDGFSLPLIRSLSIYDMNREWFEDKPLSFLTSPSLRRLQLSGMWGRDACSLPKGSLHVTSLHFQGVNLSYAAMLSLVEACRRLETVSHRTDTLEHLQDYQTPSSPPDIVTAPRFVRLLKTHAASIERLELDFKGMHYFAWGDAMSMYGLVHLTSLQDFVALKHLDMDRICFEEAAMFTPTSETGLVDVLPEGVEVLCLRHVDQGRELSQVRYLGENRAKFPHLRSLAVHVISPDLQPAFDSLSEAFNEPDFRYSVELAE